jgi:hypothetical protein
MRLIFRSFGLSFAVLWRYLILLPFLIIFCGLIAMVAFILPLVGIVIGMGAITFATMIGMRSAFQALGDHNDLDFAQLVKASLMFGIAQIIMGVLVAIVGLAAFAVAALMTPEIAPLLGNLRINTPVIIAFFQTSPITQMISVGSIVLFQVISAIIAVPMAGAAYSATPHDTGSDIWRGLGASFWPICAILLIIYAASTQSGIYDGLGQIWLFLTVTAISAFSGDPIIGATAAQLGWMIGCFVYVIWTSCWYFAAAALGWHKHLHDRQEAIAAIHRPQHVDGDALRALRESRQVVR